MAASSLVPGDIKSATMADLERLTRNAQANGWSAVGRPQLVGLAGESVHRLMLLVSNYVSAIAYRCVVAVFTGDDEAKIFTLDVAIEEFHHLPAITIEELVELARQGLFTFPMLEFDPAQLEASEEIGRQLRARRQRKGM